MHNVQKPFLDPGLHKHPFHADTILPGVLKHSSNADLGSMDDIGIIADNERVFPTKFQTRGCERFRSIDRDSFPDGRTSSEENLIDVCFNEGLADIGGSDGALNKLWIMTAQRKGPSHNARNVDAGEDSLLTRLDDDAVSGEDGGEDGVEKVVNGVIPGRYGGDDTEWHVLDTGLFVDGHGPHRAFRRAQRVFAFLYQPSQLFQRRYDLAEIGLKRGLASVLHGNADKRILVVQNVRENGLKDVASLLKRSACPFCGSGARAVDQMRDIGIAMLGDASEMGTGGGVDTRDAGGELRLRIEVGEEVGLRVLVRVEGVGRWGNGVESSGEKKIEEGGKKEGKWEED